MRDVETRGLILYSQNYKEKDKLVKIFTESFGKRMFFIKNFGKSKYASGLQNFTSSVLVATINDEGFSFIDDVSETVTYKHIIEDIFVNAHASYIISLADSAIADNHYDPALFSFLIRALELLDEGFDMEIITNIFELQVLNRFGVSLNFAECAFCHTTAGPFDFSYKFSGCLCPKHFDEDLRRSHLDPNVIYLCNLFQEISLDELKKISIKPEMKQKIRQFIDGLYDEYVGIHLKAKKFLDGMGNWADIMK
ncbi:DNA repair protein RecO [Lactococcus protaetiae]|uniref:DNA repair protein RecO n=1 Tax=Lactococcus protaetiae TaxID=2592653 RepID=A0A514ZBB0_9LACT|nr:DNA repair protein RecO [Lactococcus protaetiae]MCL2114093.1 DNA repair protein RecO [Streptococcaceae bacterium]QDK71884.1 DNA repair protein RecO [Lactococcus protaetiae]